MVINQLPAGRRNGAVGQSLTMVSPSVRLFSIFLWGKVLRLQSLIKKASPPSRPKTHPDSRTDPTGDNPALKNAFAVVVANPIASRVFFAM